MRPFLFMERVAGCSKMDKCNIDADRTFGIIYRTSALHAEFLEKALTFTSYNHFYT